MPFTSYLADWSLAILFGHAWGGLPSPFQLVLLDSKGDEMTGEPGYARVNIPDDTWGYAISGVTSNIAKIVFPVATGDWSTDVWFWGILTATNDRLMLGLLDEQYTVLEKDLITFDVGTLTIYLEADDPGGSFSDYAENGLLDHIFGKSTFTEPPTILVGLLTAQPDDDFGNIDSVEVQAPSYQRVETYHEDWSRSVEGDAWNSSLITFPIAEEFWGVVSHYALFDTWSNPLMWGVLPQGTEILTGYMPHFLPQLGVPPTGRYPGIDMWFMYG